MRRAGDSFGCTDPSRLGVAQPAHNAYGLVASPVADPDEKRDDDDFDFAVCTVLYFFEVDVTLDDRTRTGDFTLTHSHRFTRCIFLLN